MGEFQPLARGHAQQFDAGNRPVDAADARSVALPGDAPLGEALLHGVETVSGGEDGDVVERNAFTQLRGDAVDDVPGFFPAVAGLEQHWNRAASAGRFGMDAGHVVVVFLAFGQQAVCKVQGHREDFGGVAVVELEDAGASLCLDADAREAEPAALCPAVDGLGIVIQDEQGLGLGGHELGCHAQPGGIEVMCFVDQQGAVLALRHHAAGQMALHDANLLIETLRRGKSAGNRQLVAAHHLAAPLVEGLDLDPQGRDAALGEHLAQPVGKWAVVARDQNGRTARGSLGRELLGPENEHHGVARSCRAVDDAVAGAEGAGGGFLLQVHDLDQVGNGQHAAAAFRAAGGAHGDAQVGEQVPAHPVLLRQRQRDGKSDHEHGPQAFLELLGVHGFRQIIGQQGFVGGKDLGKVGHCAGVAAAYAAECDAPAVGHDAAPAVKGALLLQLGGTLQHGMDFTGIAHGLPVGVVAGGGAVFRLQGDLVAVELQQGGEFPVLHFQHQHSPAGIEDDEVGLALPVSDGDVVPDDVVVRQAALQLLQHLALAGVAAVALDASEDLGKESHEAVSLRCRKGRQRGCVLPGGVPGRGAPPPHGGMDCRVPQCGGRCVVGGGARPYLPQVSLSPVMRLSTSSPSRDRTRSVAK